MTEKEISEAVAETDGEPAAGTVAAPSEAASESYTGRCIGGPWDSSDADVRFPEGFLLIHRPDNAVWIYDRQVDGNFHVRSAEPELLDDEKRMRAASEGAFDIRVLDPAAVEPAVKP